MKKDTELKQNFGAVYAGAIYPDLAKIFQGHGYALAVHGSVARDFDLIAVPWAETVSSIDLVFDSVEKEFGVKINRKDYADRNHGRRAWIMTFGFGESAVDLSLFPND